MTTPNPTPAGKVTFSERAAASVLRERLADHTWVHSVAIGVKDGAPELVIYTRRPISQKHVPTEFLGFPVRQTKIGKVIP